MTMTPERAAEFKENVSNKIEAILDEFAGGTISRAHFDVLYERYSRQLGIAEQALETGDFDEIDRIINDIPTVALHAAVRGIAIGMSIIRHRDMSIIRQFGDVTLNTTQLFRIVAEWKDHQLEDITAFSDIQHLSGDTWLVACSLEHTSLVTLFRNEPAAKQVQELERRHRDFESANRNILNHANPDPDTLVYPVELFVKNHKPE